MRIEYLDLDVKAPPTVRIEFFGAVGTLDLGDIQIGITIPVDPDSTLVDRLRWILSPAKGQLETIQRMRVTPSGWTLVHEGILLGHPPVTAIDMRRRVGNLDLVCSTGSTHARKAAQAEEVCASLRPVPGSMATEPPPIDEPVLRMRDGGSLVNSLQVGLDLWADGSVEFHSARCEKWRGAMRRSIRRWCRSSSWR